MQARLALCKFILAGDAWDARALLKLGALALDESLEKGGGAEGQQNLLRAVETFVVQATTDRAWSRVGDAGFLAEQSGLATKAEADATVLGADKARWRVLPESVDAAFSLDLGWYTFGGLDLCWVLAAQTWATIGGSIQQWLAEVGDLAPRDE